MPLPMCVRKADVRAREAFEEAETRRAEALAALTDDERKWIARAKRLIRDMPESLHMLAADNGGLTVYRGGAETGNEVEHIAAPRVAGMG